MVYIESPKGTIANFIITIINIIIIIIIITLTHFKDSMEYSKCTRNCYQRKLQLNTSINNQNEPMVYRGYYTVARRKTIFYSLAALVRKILFLPQENKIHIFKPPCNVLLLYRQKEIEKIIDFNSPKSNCDGSDL